MKRLTHITVLAITFWAGFSVWNGSTNNAEASEKAISHPSAEARPRATAYRPDLQQSGSRLSVTFTNVASEPVYVKVFSPLGETLYNERVNARDLYRQEFRTRNLPQGEYTLLVHSEQQYIYSEDFSVN